MSLIKLPGVEVTTHKSAHDYALMVLGGRAPSSELLAMLASRAELLAVDRGVEACRAAGVVPAMLIGDRDSGSASGWLWAQEHGAITRDYPSDKDLTDFQLALETFAAERKDKTIILTGGFGGRFDHLLSVVASFVSMARGALCMVDDAEGMLFIRGGEGLALSFARTPKALSLLSLSPVCRGVNICGVQWPLCGAELRFDFPYAVSNRVAEGEKVEVSCREGTLALYWTWDDAF